jgi:predicted AAA+ superfamily ATPase
MVERALRLPARPRTTFFLWGPRQTGKSTLLRARYPKARRVDLLSAREFVRYSRDPGLLREEIESSRERFVVIDEVQKVPALLDEVHWLIENRAVVFALCGSSARKVRRGQANLLGGRALRYELRGLVSAELGEDFDVIRAVNHGYLPRHYLARSARDLLRSYVDDYLKEEVAAEGLTRNLPVFADFLAAAALGDGQLVNYAMIARECGVSPYTVTEYYRILVDTLLGSFLPAYRKRPKRRVIQAPKFYFADVGVVNHLARRGPLQPGGELFGHAFENWVLHELAAYRAYRGFAFELAYWRLASGIEVDFVIDDLRLAVEAKATTRVHADHLRGLRELRADHRVGKRVVVSMEQRPRRTDDGIEILPAGTFGQRLWADDLVRP